MTIPADDSPNNGDGNDWAPDSSEPQQSSDETVDATAGVEVAGVKASTTKSTVPMEEDSDSEGGGDDERDVFAAFNRAPSASPGNKTKKKKPAASVQIIIASLRVQQAQECSYSDQSKLDGNAAVPVLLGPSPLPGALAGLEFDPEEMEKELEDSLRFFEQPHEEQDAAFQKFEKEQRSIRIKVELQKLDEEEMAGRREIEFIVGEQLKEKRAATDRSVERYKLKTAAEEKRDMDKLQQLFNEKSGHNQSKIHQGIQNLRKKHANENQRLIQQHRQNLQRRPVPEQVANAEWTQASQQLRQKHQSQMAEFARKGEEIKKKTEMDYKRESVKIKKQYERRLQEVDANRKSIISRMFAGFQGVRARYVKEFVHGIAKRRGLLQKELDQISEKRLDSTSSDGIAGGGELAKGDKEETKMALQQTSPLKSSCSRFQEPSHDFSGAAARHKHRKGILSQIPKQLSVEIHNEGIWLSKLSEKKTDDKTKDDDNEKKHFIPWGFKAREVLQSIVCGEIPMYFESDKFNLGDSVAVNGGHIRCVMTDLRTSDETASAQRAGSLFERQAVEVKKLEEEGSELAKNMDLAQKDLDTLDRQRRELEVKLVDAKKDTEKVKANLKGVRTKFARYLGPDGNPLPGHEHSEKLKAALTKLHASIENGEKRAKAIHSKIGEAKNSMQKKHASIKQAQRNLAILSSAIKKKKQVLNEIKSGQSNFQHHEDSKSAFARVELHTASLDATAEKRRAELNHKRNSSSSTSWIHSFAGISSMLKRSLYFKMHRRRQQIVLRPSFTSTMADLRKHVASKYLERNNGRITSSGALESELEAAEQTYLLATHPIAPPEGKLPSVPNPTAWAEPGWQLNLDVPKTDETGRILPCASLPPLVQSNLSELYSAPGCQAASMLKNTHLRSLEAPLSAIGITTSLSETNPSVGISSDVMFSSNDPFRPSKEMVKASYTFTSKAPPPKPAPAQRKNSSTAKDSVVSPEPTKVTKKKAQTGTPSDKNASRSKTGTPGGNSARLPAPAKATERKRKIVTQTDSTPPKPAQRRKSDVARQQQQKEHHHHQQQQPPQQQVPPPLPMNDPNLQPRPIMTQHQQAQHQQAQAPFNMGQPMQQQPNPYGHFMKAMPSPVTTQNTGHRASFQFPNNPQMQQQFRMMQQQQQQQHAQHRHQQQAQQAPMGYVQTPQGLQQMPQFFSQMAQQQFVQQPMAMPGLAPMPHPPQQPQVPPPPQPPQHHQPPQASVGKARQSKPSSEEQNDPLFMLKEM